VVDDTAGLFGTMGSEDRVASIRELFRVLRSGGRAIVVGAAPPSGLGAILSRSQGEPSFARSGDAGRTFEEGGFKSARTLAERDGLIFVEAVKPRGPEISRAGIREA
jgi:hypothetical protein